MKTPNTKKSGNRQSRKSFLFLLYSLVAFLSFGSLVVSCSRDRSFEGEWSGKCILSDTTEVALTMKVQDLQDSTDVIFSFPDMELQAIETVQYWRQNSNITVAVYTDLGLWTFHGKLKRDRFEGKARFDLEQGKFELTRE